MANIDDKKTNSVLRTVGIIIMLAGLLAVVFSLFNLSGDYKTYQYFGALLLVLGLVLLWLGSSNSYRKGEFDNVNKLDEEKGVEDGNKKRDEQQQ